MRVRLADRSHARLCYVVIMYSALYLSTVFKRVLSALRVDTARYQILSPQPCSTHLSQSFLKDTCSADQRSVYVSALYAWCVSCNQLCQKSGQLTAVVPLFRCRTARAREPKQSDTIVI
jgi:hypothetical protein